MRQVFCSFDLTEIYCVHVASIFMKLYAETDKFENIWTINYEICWTFDYLYYETWLRWKSSSIYWHNMMNLSKIFEKSWFISWIWILFDIFCLKASIFAVSFHSSSSTRFKNSEKKLVNFWFLCQRFLSFVIAVCSWLVSS